MLFSLLGVQPNAEYALRVVVVNAGDGCRAERSVLIDGEISPASRNLTGRPDVLWPMLGAQIAWALATLGARVDVEASWLRGRNGSAKAMEA